MSGNELYPSGRGDEHWQRKAGEMVRAVEEAAGVRSLVFLDPTGEPSPGWRHRAGDEVFIYRFEDEAGGEKR